MLVILLLILAILIGVGLSLFANQNPESVNINFGNMRWDDIPLYIIVALSLLLGLGVAWLFGVINSISSSITIFDKDLKINKTRKVNQDLNSRIESLRIENEKLKEKIRLTS